MLCLFRCLASSSVIADFRRECWGLCVVQDVSNVLELARGTGLANKDPADVAAPLLAAADVAGERRSSRGRGGSGPEAAAAKRRGALTKDAFDRCIRTLVPGRRLSQGQKERFSGLLSTVYLAFDFNER